jgi:hypothetical protein
VEEGVLMELHMRWSGMLVVCAACGLLLAALAGCSSASEDAESVESEAAGSAEADVAEEAAAQEHWLDGQWIVEFTLVSVDPDEDWARAAADQPVADWECSVEDGMMTIEAETNTEQLVTYSAPLAENADGTLSFDASDDFADDDGVVWTSHIIVDITPMDDDSFTAEQWGEISSDTGGKLYEAVWSALGTKVE